MVVSWRGGAHRFVEMGVVESGRGKAESGKLRRDSNLLSPDFCPPLSGRGVVQKSAVTLRQRVDGSRLPTRQRATFAPRKKFRRSGAAILAGVAGNGDDEYGLNQGVVSQLRFRESETSIIHCHESDLRQIQMNLGI